MLPLRVLLFPDISEHCVLVQLTADVEVLAGRMAKRRDHFMPSSLISSQLSLLEALEPSEGACLTCHVTVSVEAVVENIQHFLFSLTPPAAVCTRS